MFQTQPLSQQDPAWKKVHLGNDPTCTIGSYGCLLTALTMLANGYGASETPATLNDKMKAAGGFQGANVIPAVLPQVVSGVRFKRYQECKSYPAPLADIGAALAAQRPVIVQVDYSPTAGLQSHWVLLVDQSGSDYLMWDPWPYPPDPAPLPLTRRFGFAGSPGQVILAALWMDGTQPLPAPVPQPIPTQGYAVYPAVDGLALRQGPEVAADNLVTRLQLGLKLYVREDASAAAGKIGHQGQWIQVIESRQGYPGYVAAWLVAPGPAAPPVPPPQPYLPPESQPALPPASALLVYASVDGLALRSQPIVADSTLLKREPANTQLSVLEDASAALGKLGVSGQWLAVKDIEGTPGYVAAWYVSQYPAPALGVPAPTSPPAPVSGALVVRTTVDSLALRSQPVIADSNLIRRVPLQSEFLVLDAPGVALARLGQQGQWLHVQAADGTQGYIAAWYAVQRPAAGTS